MNCKGGQKTQSEGLASEEEDTVLIWLSQKLKAEKW
jgi:hypothetical protein